MLLIGVATSAAGTLLYLFYSTWTRAIFIESQNGLFFSLAELALLDLAARATPKGCEGLGYSLMLSIRNVAGSGADIVGSHLADHKWPFGSLVFLNAGTTAIVLLLLPFLPAALMRSKDRVATQPHKGRDPAALACLRPTVRASSVDVRQCKIQNGNAFDRIARYVEGTPSLLPVAPQHSRVLRAPSCAANGETAKNIRFERLGTRAV
jgi:hypothetical protein